MRKPLLFIVVVLFSLAILATVWRIRTQPNITEEACELILGAPLPQLSMGMTGDFEVAIEEGATMVRIGTALFGERKKQTE